jgi:segregation and condensation protein B
MEDNVRKIEAVLFFKGEPVDIPTLSKLLGKPEPEIHEALAKLEQDLATRGIRLMRANGEVQLVTSPDVSELIEQVRKEELSRDIGKAGAETLAIVLYRGPISRSQIDYIRGVNSTFILRNLMIRGLVERVNNPDDQRSFLYKPTFELLSHLGVTKIEDLPEYELVQEEIRNFMAEREVSAAETSEPDQPAGEEHHDGNHSV